MSEDNKGTFETWTEELTVAGNDLIDTLKELLADASVHRLQVVNNKNGKVVVDIPAVAGVPAAIFLNIWLLLGALILYVADFKIVIERRAPKADGSDSGAADNSAETANAKPATAQPAAKSEAAKKADEKAKADAKKSADAKGKADKKSSAKAESSKKTTAKAEKKTSAASGKKAKSSSKKKSKKNAKKSSTPAEHCQGMTKAGKPCKRMAMEGSKYCYSHQPS